MNNIKIIILAGGFGTRLRSVVNDVPKPMAPILGKPFLDYQIKEIQKYFPENKIYILTHYLSHVIEQYYDEDENIEIVKENEPLGTGGSIKNAINILRFDNTESILVFNGDTYIKPNLNDFLNEKEKISILASFQKDCSRYGTLSIVNDNIIDFKEKDSKERNSYINAGCYFFKDINFFFDINEDKFSIEDKFKEYLSSSSIKAHKYNDVFIDIGIPDDYEKMINYIKETNYANR